MKILVALLHIFTLSLFAKNTEKPQFLVPMKPASFLRAMMCLLLAPMLGMRASAIPATWVSRADVQRSWRENGGLIPCEFFHSFKDGRLIAVRIQWRPNEMPASVAVNRSERIKWLVKHQPTPKATDILEKVSLPFETKFAID